MRAPRFIHQHRFDLTADAVLLSSGLYALASAIGLTIWWVSFGLPTDAVMMEGTESSLIENIVSVVLALLMVSMGTIVGPALAWRLHGRVLHWRLLLAVVAAPMLFGAVTATFPLLASLFAFLLSPFTRAEFAGGLVLLVLIAAIYLAIVAHAARDAIAPAGDPPLLERLRLLSLTGLVLLALVVGGAIMLGYSGELGDALIFAILVGFSAAAVVLVAGFLDRPARQTQSTAPPRA